MKSVKFGIVFVVAVVLSGCGTDRVLEPEVVSSTTTDSVVATEVVETTTVSVSHASASVVLPSAPLNAQTTTGCGQQVSASQGVDIFQGVKKPRGTIAADTPKFVSPERK